MRGIVSYWWLVLRGGCELTRNFLAFVTGCNFAMAVMRGGIWWLWSFAYGWLWWNGQREFEAREERVGEKDSS